MIARLPHDVRSVTDLPSDFRPEPLGERDALIDSIRTVAPDADFSDPHLGHLDGDAFSMEIFLGESDPVDTIILTVRGGADVIKLIADILSQLHAHAVDLQTGELFTIDGATDSIAAWRAFRDRVIPHSPDQHPPARDHQR